MRRTTDGSASDRRTADTQRSGSESARMRRVATHEHMDTFSSSSGTESARRRALNNELDREVREPVHHTSRGSIRPAGVWTLSTGVVSPPVSELTEFPCNTKRRPTPQRWYYLDGKRVYCY